MKIKPLKVRAWKLAEGGLLVLLFIRTPEDKLELLAELHADNEAGLQKIIADAMKTMDGAMAAAGLDGKSYAEFPGAKKA